MSSKVTVSVVDGLRDDEKTYEVDGWSIDQAGSLILHTLNPAVLERQGDGSMAPSKQLVVAFSRNGWRSLRPA